MRVKLFNHFIKIVWVYLLVYLVFDFFLLWKDPFLSRPLLIAFAVISGFALIGWLYVTVRVALFKSKLVRLLNLLFEGNYDAGMQNHPALTDELFSVTDLVNKVAGRLKSFDRLRQEKVEFHSKALDMISRMTEEGILTANLDTRKFHLNPVVQEMFDLKLEEVDFDAIERREMNKEFFQVFWEATKYQKVAMERNVQLQLPVRDKTRFVAVTILPLKDRDENVKLAVIFVRDVSVQPDS